MIYNNLHNLWKLFAVSIILKNTQYFSSINLMNKWRWICLFNSIKILTFETLNDITKLDSKSEMRSTCRRASFLIQFIIQLKSLIAAQVHELFYIKTSLMHAISMYASKNAFKCFLCTSHCLWNYSLRLTNLIWLQLLISLNLISFFFNLSN